MAPSNQETVQLIDSTARLQFYPCGDNLNYWVKGDGWETMITSTPEAAWYSAVCDLGRHIMGQIVRTAPEPPNPYLAVAGFGGALNPLLGAQS